MKKLSLKDKIKMYWYGLKLKPTKMMNSDCTWVVMSSHPLYSITWTWAIYWTKPKCWRFKQFDFKQHKQIFTLRSLFKLGFSISTQDVMIRDEFKSSF